MLPPLATGNSFNSCTLYPKALGNSSLSDSAIVPQSFDFSNLLFCQFGVSVTFPWRCATTIFSHHIGYIIGLSSKGQVRRITATGAITTVQNLKPFGNCAISQLPSYSVRISAFPLDRKLTISTTVFRGLPVPAVSRFVNFAPKSFFKRWPDSRFWGFSFPLFNNVALRAMIVIFVTQALACLLPVVPTLTKLPQSILSWIKAYNIHYSLSALGCRLRGVSAPAGHLLYLF